MLFSILKQFLAPEKSRLAYVDLENLPFFDLDQLERKVALKFEDRRARYLDWPAFVHLETIALCNAACNFCPYPQMERKGEKMPDALIEKVIGDLTDIPRDVRFQLSPYKVSEPFLEPRLFDILETINARLPNAWITIITNGSALTERNIEGLRKVRNFAHLNISLNYDNAQEYESVMKLSFERTLRRLDVLHQKKTNGELAFPVRLTRVSENRLSDIHFVRW